MSEPFDPYYTWLGIPREEQPPDYYRLLAVRRFENNPEVITNALQARETLVRSFESGPRAEVARQMLNELTKARKCLLHLDSKGAYDRDLRNKDAPKLSMTSGNQPLARPDAPRRPRWASDSAGDAVPLPVEQGPAAATQPIAAPNYQTAPVTTMPVNGSMPVAAYPGTAYRPAKPSASPLLQNPLVLVAIGVVLLLFVAMIVAAAAILGGSALLARLPSGNSVEPGFNQPEPAANNGTSNAPLNGSASGAPSGAGSIIKVKYTDAGGTKGAGRELALRVGEPVDLLASYDPASQRPRPKSVTKDAEGALVSGQAVLEVLMFPQEMPPEYVLDTAVTLSGTSNGVIQGLSAGGKQCQITVDGFQGERDGRGMRTALEIIDGHRPHDIPNYPCSEFGSLLTSDRPANLRYVVLKNRILMESDGRLVLDWTGGMERVSTNRMFARGGSQNLFWGTWQTKCRLSKCVVRPVLEVK